MQVSVERRKNMSSTTIYQPSSISPTRLATLGAISGLAGGMVFGMMMGMMGMLPMVGMLVGSENAIVGFIVHMMISAIFGAVYGLAAGRFQASYKTALVGGMINGIVWWVLGALVLMPLMLGMTEMVFAVGQAQWMSLMGHIIYGLVTSFVFVALVNRR
jgi:uncharacterized membrane protein YagU involved in acid resistance